MIKRRSLLETLMLAAAGSGTPGIHAEEHATTKPVFSQALPDVQLEGWSVTAVEVFYPAGVASPVHRHPGFVLGYVLEGEIAFGLKGEKERIVPAGQMFYEPPGSIHEVSRNASGQKPARLLAMIFAKAGEKLTQPA